MKTVHIIHMYVYRSERNTDRQFGAKCHPVKLLNVMVFCSD
jgi:hypothetical protein